MGRRSLVAFVALGVALGGVSALGGGAGAQEEAETDIVNEVIAQAMVRDYDLDIDEARRRTDEQNAYEEVVPALTEMAGEDVWAGSWIDHESDGGLVLNLKRGAGADFAEALLQRAAGHNVRTQEVDYSLAELEAVVAEANIRLGEPADSRTSSVDMVANEVEVSIPESDADAASASVDALEGLPVRFRYGVVRTPIACHSYYMACTQPLRGGLEIAAAANVGNGTQELKLCTSALIVKSQTSANRYMLTAGHCVENTNVPGSPGSWGVWITRDPSNNTIWVGPPYQRPGWSVPYLSTGSHDIAMIGPLGGSLVQVTNSEVLVQPSFGSSQTTLNQTYDINGTALASGLSAGSYLCYSGAVSKTECSQFVSAHPNFIKLRIPDAATTVCHGDSGGPVYKLNKIYAIMSETDLPTVNTQWHDTLIKGAKYYDCAGQTDYWWAYSITVGLGQTNTQIM